MATAVFAVTTPQLRTTGRMSHNFMVQQGVPDDILNCKVWGLVTIRRKGDNEVNPFRLVQGEPYAIGDNGVMRWDVHLFQSGRGNIFSGGVDEHRPQEDGLQQLLQSALEDKGSAALLMERSVFNRFETVCKTLGIALLVHHHQEPLSTS